MTLLEKQMLFSGLCARLVLRMVRRGYGVTLGHAYRSPEEAASLGFPNSNHTRRLAVDINLFEFSHGEWVYLTDGESHRPFGEWWERQHELCRWGGRFGDGNHYSLEHEGVE